MWTGRWLFDKGRRRDLLSTVYARFQHKKIRKDEATPETYSVLYLRIGNTRVLSKAPWTSLHDYSLQLWSTPLS